MESIALDHKAACVRIEAARGLGDIVASDPKDTLMAVTLEDGDVRVRRAALTSLGRQHLYKEEVSDFLIRHADIERSDFALADSLAALAELGAHGSLEFVLRCLHRPSFDDVVAAAAVAALARLRAQEHMAEIEERLGEAYSPRVRAAAARALGSLAAGWPAKSRQRLHCAERLHQALYDPWYLVRSAAAAAMAALNEAGAADKLQAMARREVDGRVLRTLREALTDAVQAQGQNKELRQLREELDRLAQGQRRLEARTLARSMETPPAPEAKAVVGRIARARALLEGRRGG